MMGNSIIKILYWPLVVILIIAELCDWLRFGEHLGIGAGDNEDEEW